MMKTLGLAQKAHKLVIGTDQVLSFLRKKKLYLVIIADNVSANTKKMMTDKTNYYNCPLLTMDYHSLNQAIGTNHTKVIGITDLGFSKLVLKKE